MTKYTNKNQIRWLDWSNSAFDKAKKENKLVLLSISAVWCHWCHNLDKETYSHPAVVKKINSEFVPVRVDTDVRPDINDRYNLGGWPSVAVLRHDGSLVSGVLYEPPEKFLAFIEHSKELAKMPPEKVTAEMLPQRMQDVRAALEQFKRNVEAAFDPLYGGFGFAPKFPHQEVLLFLLEYYSKSKDKKVGEMLKKTLHGMLAGEFSDKESGGFFRYATQQNWTIPHFEKMLEDNALLADVYSLAYSLFGEEKFRTVAKETCYFLLTVLFDKTNCFFYGSQDADEAFCKLSKDERTKAQLPFIDKRIYVGWNALALSALLNTAARVKEPLFKTVALRGLKNLAEQAMTKEGIVHCIIEGKPFRVYLAKDAVLLQSAFLAAYDYSGDKFFLATAKKLTKIIEENFVEKNVVYDIRKERNAVGFLADRHVDLIATAYFAMNLLKLAGKKNVAVMLSTAAQDLLSGIHAAAVARAVLRL